MPWLYCAVEVASVVVMVVPLPCPAELMGMIEGLASMRTVRAEVAVRPDWSVAT